MKKLHNFIITIGNVYLDHNAYEVESNGFNELKAGKEYFAKQYETVLGGSAVNFARQARNLGLRVAFVGQVGDDEEGKEIKRLLLKERINSDLVNTVKGETTSAAFNMILSHNGEFVGVHWGSASRTLQQKYIDPSHPLFQQATAVYFGGTAKQGEIFQNFPTVLARLQNQGIRTIIDPNRFPVLQDNASRDILLESLQYADCYLPNAEELKQTTGEQDIDRAIQIALKRGVKMVVVKRGGEGCIVCSQHQQLVIPGFYVVPKTTVGAGDAFNAGFVTQLLAEKPLLECGRYANAVAGIKVGENKTATHIDVTEFIKNHSVSS
ncbi:carbohydrate kinase family protein [Candidatus Roizmanbacteria bacterium]|nr:carbohydrate kinase family protein [Candidatus Roizmanbacteria bacterium]